MADKRLIFSGLVLAVVTISALFADQLAPKDPLEQDLLYGLLPPAWLDGAEPGFYLGTDSLGRDVFSRLIYGARIALIVALVAGLLAALLGTVLGLIAGFFGGWADQVISRMVDIWMAFPPVLLSIILVAVIGAGLHAVIIAIVIIDWTRFCRVVRANVREQLGRDYVQSARAQGLSRRSILIHEIMPNVAPVILVLLTTEMGMAVIVEAILSFVGLGISSDTPSFGGLISEGRSVIHQVPWLMVMPCACLVMIVLAFNLLGDALQDRFDPVLRR